ncbi:MAG TPA: autotransporter outer membrane beta-barrel domain-containing protein [Veillonellaceae bacterium]|nr:autotransporter outer membrane beta-barrel domain-containing protein [Veillonellaceae bacterium]
MSNKTKWLKWCVAAALFSGTLGCAVTAGAETVDMTTSEHLGGVTINDPESDMGSYSNPYCYVYKWDKNSQKIIGGTVTVASNNHKAQWSTGVDFYTTLRINESDLNGLSAKEVKEALSQLADKFINKVTTNPWKVTNDVYVQIVDDASKENPTVLRGYQLSFYDSASGKTVSTGSLGTLKDGIYTTPVRNNGDSKSEYDFDKKGVWRKGGSAAVINIDTSKKTDDNVYAAVIADPGKNVEVTNVEGHSTWSDSLAVTVDAKNQKGSAAYGVYNTAGSSAAVGVTSGNFQISGDKSAIGVLAENTTGNDVSHVNLKGSFTFNLDGTKTTGMEAGKNGEIVCSLPDMSPSPTAISSPSGYALYAHDGGKITLDSMNVVKSGDTAVYAANGGQITVKNVTGLNGSIKTDDNKDSIIDVTLGDKNKGNLDGHINTVVKGTFIGDINSSGTTTIKGGTWNGSLMKENGTIDVKANGVWDVGDKTASHIGRLTGSDSNIQRGYVNMSNNDINIDKYSGNTTFVYKHDASNPAVLQGGKVTIQSSKPLTIYSSGIGDKEQAVSSTIDSTITAATSAEGITNEETAEKVLNALADRLYYTAYVNGERNLTGTVEIQEGLTSKSVAKYLSNISWNDKTGKAEVSSIVEPYTALLLGDITQDKAYKDYYDEGTKTYRFNKDTNITIKVSEDPRRMKWGQFYIGAVTNWGDQWDHFIGRKNPMRVNYKDGPSYTIDMDGHDLSIDMEAFPPAGTTGSQPNWSSYALLGVREGTITIDNPGKINLAANANYYYGGCIRASSASDTPTGTHVVINNDNSPEHAVTMRGGIATPGYELDYWTISTYGWKTLEKYPKEQVYKYDNSVDIKGLVDIETLTGAPAIVGKSGHINIGGGRIVAKNYPAVMTRSNTTTINLNVLADEDGHIKGAGSNDLQITGNLWTATPFWGGGGTINAAFTTKDSVLNGQVYGPGTQTLWLQNGAVWNNGPQLMHSWSSQTDSPSDAASLVTALYGGTSAETDGNIFQTSTQDLTISKLNGYVNVFVNHDENNAADFSKTGNIIITSADKTGSENAHVRMITSDVKMADMADKTKVTGILEGLANKLYYSAYTSGERNLDASAEIAEGLTSSAFTYRVSDVGFNEENGQGTVKGEDVISHYPGTQIMDKHTEAITNDSMNEEYYREKGILKEDGSYDFTMDPSSVVLSKKIIDINGTPTAAAVASQSKDISVNAKSSTLELTASGGDGLDAAAIYAGIGTKTTIQASVARITGDGTNTAKAVLADGGTVEINKDGSGKTVIKGDVESVHQGVVKIHMTDGSSMKGTLKGDSAVRLQIDPGAAWEGAGNNTESDITLGGTWKQTGDSMAANLTGEGGSIDKTDENSGSTVIDHYKGSMDVVYRHDAYEPATIYGGDTIVKKADKNSTINLVTDNAGLNTSDKSEQGRKLVYNAMNALAGKLTYSANDGNITGRIKIAEGLTAASAALNSGKLAFDADGHGKLNYSDVDDNTLTIEYGSEETQMMKGTKSALLGVSMMWRSNNNDLQRRLGDLRLGQAESGVWARYVGGKNKFDEQNTYMSQTYDIGQVGYDRKAGSWLVGAALDYGKGDVNYTGGKGKEHMATLALYGTRVSDDGKYFDIIFKTGRLKNEFHVSNEIGNRLNADYHTWGNSISAEYGKRFVRDDGFYLDPSVELTMGRLNSKNFSGHSDLGELNVKQHDFDSAIGRIGLGIGRQTERSNAFLKLALAHEFGGSFKTDFYADDGGLKSTRIDLQDTWLDMEIGGSLSIGRNTYLYGTYTHNFGADMETKWRADVGVRYTF